MTSRNRRRKFQYSIPMHLVDQLPAIREESPTKSFGDDYDLDVIPVRWRNDGVRFAPEVTQIPPLPPLPSRHSSPLNEDHASLRLLISDYLNYVRDARYHPDHLSNYVNHRQSCWCCADRNVENISKTDNYEPGYSYTEPLPNIAPKISRIINPTERWVPPRRFRYDPVDFRYPRNYVLPEPMAVYYQDLDDYIGKMAKTENFYSDHVLEADEVYRTSMKRLKNKAYDIGGL